MTHQEIESGLLTSSALPEVRKITVADLKESLRLGLDDFRAKPSHLVFLGIIYPVVGLIVARLAISFGDALPLLYPLVAGFALMGPVMGIGLYELSRRREKGLEIAWRHAFDVLRSPAIGSIAALSMLLLAVFLVWLVVAEIVFRMTFGASDPTSFGSFLEWTITTPEGWTMIVVGNAVGCLFAIVVLTISVVSFPLMLDRGVNAHTAVLTSAKAVFANIPTMIVWGLIIAVTLAIGSIPLFVGLAVVVPILAHASWHLYRRVVVP